MFCFLFYFYMFEIKFKKSKIIWEIESLMAKYNFLFSRLAKKTRWIYKGNWGWKWWKHKTEWVWKTVSRKVHRRVGLFASISLMRVLSMCTVCRKTFYSSSWAKLNFCPVCCDVPQYWKSWRCRVRRSGCGVSCQIWRCHKPMRQPVSFSSKTWQNPER